MSAPKTQADLQSYIDNQVEESIDLDYKRADSLGKTDGRKAEIVKDVSAMANAAGGIIIYGIAEYDDVLKKHLPEKLDPVDRIQFTREWLDQVIGTVRPKIDGVIITPVSLDTSVNDVAYIIEIPQATTAHQARDGRYYKRFNFISEWMPDHEIRDVMARAFYPIVDLKFKIRIESWSIGSYASFGLGVPEKKKKVPRPFFEVEVHNSSRRLANYITAWVKVPIGCLTELPPNCTLSSGNTSDSEPCDVICIVNRHRDIVGHRPALDFSSPIYSEPYFHPILPSLDHQLAHIEIVPAMFKTLVVGASGVVEWEVQADNAPLKTGTIAIPDIENIWEYKSEEKA